MTTRNDCEFFSLHSQPAYVCEPKPFGKSPLAKIIITLAACAAVAITIRSSAQFLDIGGDLISREYGHGDGFLNTAQSQPRIFVLYDDAVPASGKIVSFSYYSQSFTIPSPDPNITYYYPHFNAYILRPTGNANEYTVIFDSGTYDLASPSDSIVTFTLPTPVDVQAGDRVAHYGGGIPATIWDGNPLGEIGLPDVKVYYPSPSAPAGSSTITLGSGGFPAMPDAFGPDRSYSFAAQFDLAPVPEPAEWTAAAALGLGLFAFWHRRREAAA